MKVDKRSSGLVSKIKLLSFLAYLSGCFVPLFAADNGLQMPASASAQSADSEAFKVTDESQSAKEPVSQTPADKPGAAPVEPPKKDFGEKTVHFVAHLPQRLTLFTANVVVAAPATFVRRSVQCTASNTKELVGDTKNPILLVPAGTLSSYYGLTSGLVEGLTFGVINSWKHSADGHISKASLGLEGEGK